MAWLVACAAAAACTGSMSGSNDEHVDDDGRVPVGGSAGSSSKPGKDGTPSSPGMPGMPAACRVTPGQSPLRLLSSAEYNHTIRDLLGVPAPDVRFPEVAGTTHLERTMESAEALAAAAVKDVRKLTGCDPATGQTCARTFIQTFGKRAYRRPLTEDEVKRYLAVFATESDFASGIGLVLRAFLQSPHFLYRPEIGVADANDAGVRKLDAWELASRLSYFLRRSMPDGALFAAAEQGTLTDRAELVRHARRLLAADEARTALAELHEAWLEYGQVSDEEKDPKLFPDFSPEIAGLMREETTIFLERAFRAGPGFLDGFLSAPYTYANAPLAKFYGLRGPTGATFEKVPVDGRKGVLAQGSILAGRSYREQTDPIHRGLLVRTRLFCEPIPSPPNDLMVMIPEPQPGETTRERFAKQAELPGCNTCHKLMNPLGFAFESFDAVGRLRTTDAGKPVDDSGEIVGTDVAGPFEGYAGMVDKLAASEQVEACVVKHWVRFALRRDLDEADDCVIGQLTQRLRETGQDLGIVVAELVATPAFVARATVE